MSLPMYPYTNMSDTNLDWLIEDNKLVHVEMKETTQYINESKTYIDGKLEDATTQAKNAQSSAENAQSSAKNATASAESASDDAEYVKSTRNQVDLLQSRVDNIIPSGTQTEGNTELIDIRVGADGVTYKSAGDSVRGQVSDLKSALSELYDGVESITFDIIKNSYPDRSTGEIKTGSNWDRTDYIPVRGGETIWTNNIYPTDDNVFYDEDKEYIQSFRITVGSPRYFTVPDNARYMICSNSAVPGRMFKTFYRVASFIDKTLTKENKAADARAVGDRLNPIETTLSDVGSFVMNLTFTDTIEPTVTKQLGYVGTDGSVSSSTDYFYTSQIDVVAGDVIYPYVGNPTQIRPMRFVCAYENDVPNVSKGVSEQTNTYTVPNGITKVVLTCFASDMDAMSFIIERQGTKITDIKHNKNAWSLMESADSVGANSRLVIDDSSALYNKKNCAYSFFGQFDTFTNVEVGHGKNVLGSSYIKIDSSYLYAYQCNGSANVEVGKYAHNLTFSDFIDVNINVDDSATPKAKVTINTNGDQFVCDDVPFVGCRGDIYALPNSAMTNVVLSYSMRDLKKDVYVFGDSYISLNDINRWPYHVIDKGYKSYMLCGFPGAGSQDMLTSFESVLKISRPKYIVWAVGMNNPDTERTYNVSWKTTLDKVMQMCNDASCELILATIPNTPVVSNYYKNNYVRSSGYRYIDFAKAVNAESINATWYSGMLSSDNVHPTQKGAKALAYRVLVDCPEIM